MEVLRSGPWILQLRLLRSVSVHRMACAKCGFYIAKGSTRAHLLEGKANL